MGASQTKQQDTVMQMLAKDLDDKGFELFQLEEELTVVNNQIKLAVKVGDSDELKKLARRKVYLLNRIETREKKMDEWRTLEDKVRDVKDFQVQDVITGRVERVLHGGTKKVKKVTQQATSMGASLTQIAEGQAQVEEQMSKALFDNGAKNVARINAEVNELMQMQASELEELAPTVYDSTVYDEEEEGAETEEGGQQVGSGPLTRHTVTTRSETL